MEKHSCLRPMLPAAVTLVLSCFLALDAIAQNPPDPAPDASGAANVFYGAVPANGANTPVLLFIPGLKGTASDWWTNNDMYADAYQSGFRTAFMSLSLDNSRNDGSMQDNALVIQQFLPQVLAHYGVKQVYVIGHSKGGLDIQAAMMDPNTAQVVKGVFTIDTPNQGTELADCAVGPPGTACFSVAKAFDLQGPAVQSLTTASVAAFRAQADPYFAQLGIPFYTIDGVTSLGNIITEATGAVLSQITSKSVRNDGLVTVPRAQLPTSYASNIGDVFANHFTSMQGSVSWADIWSRLMGQEQQTFMGWNRVATNGFGNPHNTFSWSMRWFNGKLYVGTGSEVNCVAVATFAVQENHPLVYPPLGSDCSADMKDLPLQGEIWQYTPQTKTWLRVYLSPKDIPLGNDQDGNPAFTGEEIAFRDLAVFTESDGTQALYAAGVSASSVFEQVPPYDTQGYPNPRILRSVDGVNWAPIPMDPGTFLGDIVKNSPQLWKVRGFRDLTAYHGVLYATAGDYFGTGYIIASSDPKSGNDSWHAVSPATPDFPVRSLYVWNDILYVLTGDRRITQPDATGKQWPAGYGLYKTKNPTTDISSFTPIITDGAGMALGRRGTGALSVMDFKGQLFVGTDRPTELVRVNPDDTWDLMVGPARETKAGPKTPLTGIDSGFGSPFTGHFYRMGVYDGELYLGTWDWSVALDGIPIISTLFLFEYGFDLFKTTDGIRWTAVSHDGFNDPNNYGIRTFQTTKFGIFLGTTRPVGGTQIWLNNSALDYNHDGGIDSNDVAVISAAQGQPATGPDDPRDLDGDGQITAADADLLSTQCTLAGCAPVVPPPAITPPVLTAADSQSSGGNVSLRWTPVAGAVKYHVYQSVLTPILQFLPPQGITLPIPGTGQEFTLPQDALNGNLDPFCPPGSPPATIACLLIEFAQGLYANPGLALPKPWADIADTTDTNYFAPAPTVDQSRYYVKAEDAQGNLSDPSNLVGAPAIPPDLGVLVIDANSLSFSYQNGGPLPLGKALNLSSQISPLTFSIVTHFDQSNFTGWLNVSPLSGHAPLQPGSTQVTVNVNPSGLAAGNYSATLIVTDGTGVEQNIAVSLLVLPGTVPPPGNGNTALSASAQQMSFAYTTGGTLPPAQSLQVSSLGGPVQFTVAAWSSSWLSVGPLYNSTPATLTVAAKPAGLPLGTYNGSIMLKRGPSEPWQVVPVVLTVSGPPVAAPVTDTALPSPVIPHIANGAGWNTTIRLMNTSTSPQPFTLSFFNDDGSALTLPLGADGTVSSLSGSIPPGEMRIIQSDGSAPSMVDGWALLDTADAVGASVVLNAPPGAGNSSAAQVPICSTATQQLFLPFDQTSNGTVYGTGVALTNPNSTAATITFTFTDETGRPIPAAATTFTVAPNGHYAGVLGSVFPGIAGKRGIVLVTSTEPICGLGMRYNGIAFTTLRALSQQKISSQTIAHVANGAGWKTTFLLTNTGTAPAPFTLSFRGNDGSPWSVPLGADGNTSSFTGSIAPGAMKILQSDGSGNIVQVGWGQLSTSGSIGATAIFAAQSNVKPPAEAAVPMDASGRTALYLPFDETTSGGQMATGVAFANPGAKPATVYVSFAAPDGQQTPLAQPIVVPANGHYAAVLGDLSPDTQGKRGVAYFISDVPLFGLGIQFNGQAYISVPMLTVPATAAN